MRLSILLVAEKSINPSILYNKVNFIMVVLSLFDLKRGSSERRKEPGVEIGFKGESQSLLRICGTCLHFFVDVHCSRA